MTTGFNSYKATVLADGPVGYYRLDDTGSSAADSSGNGNGGTLHGTITQSVASLLRGDADTSMTFDGSTGYISLPTGMVPTGAAPWSLECWVKVASVPANGFHALMAWGNTTGAQHFGALDLHSNGTTFTFTLSTNSGDISGANISTGTIYHVVGTYDGTSTRLYQNGVLVAGPTAFALNLSQIFASIGAFNGANSFSAATIDEAAFYTIALSATQVANHYNAGLAVTKTLGVRFRLTGQNTKTLGVRSRISTKRTLVLGTRAIISTKVTKTLGCRFVLMPQLFSGGAALFGKGTGTASYDHVRVTQYPDPSVALTNAGRAANSLVNHNGTFPTNTSVAIQTSTDNGVTWQPNASAGAPIAGITTLLHSTLVLQRKPAGYYHLSESASPSLDSSGNSYSGTWHGTITPGQTGPLQGPGEITNTALLFDGSSAFLALNSGLKTDGWSNLSVSVWFNPSASVAGATYLLANDNPASSHNGIALGLNASLAGCFVTIGNGSASATASFSTALTTGSWYHLVATWDGVAGTLALYLNGSVAATASLTGSVGMAAQAFAIGYNPVTASGYFKGSIAELSLANPTIANAVAPLTAADVFNRYNAGLAGIGTVANDSFTADTHASYTSTSGSGGSTSTNTWDTTNSRLIMVGGSRAVLLYNNLWAYDTDILADFYQAENGGIVWGWQSNQNYYELVVKDSGASVSPNTLTLNKVSGGSSTQLATGAISFPVTPTNTHHRVHMTMLAGVITVFFDENQILSYTDVSPFPAGLAGLRNDTGTSYVYLLQITPQPVSVANQYLCVQHTLTTSDPTQTPQITDHQALVSDSTFGTGVLVPTADYSTTYVSDNFDDLNTRSGYWWQVGDTAVTFQARNAKNAPFILQSTDILTGSLPTCEYSGDMYRNEQVLQGVFQTSVFTQSFTGDGQSKTWNTANPIQAVPAITVNGLAQSVGLQGVDSGKAFYWQHNSTSITQDNSQTTLRKDIDVLSVAYLGAYGIDFSLSNTGQISNAISQAQYAATDGTSGIVDAIEDVSSQNMSLDAATDYANQLLQRYGSIARTVKFVTLHNGLKAGHSLPIFVPFLNIFDSVFLVVEVGISVRSINNGIQYVYTVTASEAAALSSWTKYFSRIMRSVTGTRAKV